MTFDAKLARLLTYALAVLAGVAAALSTLPIQTILGSGPGWAVPFTDQAQTLTGHLAFQADGWRWPPLRTEELFWPRGLSTAMTDSNPLVSMLAKGWTRLTGAGPVNLLGAWLALCWAAQPVAAAYAARGLRLGPLPCLAAAVLAACWPALLTRMGHVNLCGHFLILLALGLVFRRLQGGGWLAPAALLLVAVLTHPSLFQIIAAVLAALPLQAALDRRPGWWRQAAWFAAAGVAAIGTLRLLGGPLGGGDKGFVIYSMNLLSPIWPQRSGVFGAALPVLDATGGQIEGFNWLGAGVLLLGVVALGVMALGGLVQGRPAWRPEWRPEWRPARGLLLVLGGLALLSLSSRVYAGPVMLLDLGAKPWEDIFGTFRAPGRGFWPVGYAVMLGAVAVVARLPRPWGATLLVAAAGLQVVDAGPLRRGAWQVWEAGAGIPVLPVPEGTTLFGVAPYPGCAGNAAVSAEEAVMLLDAVRGGARVRDAGVGRPPPWFNCEKMLAELTELPLRPGESRAFFGLAAAGGLRPEWLGPEAVCRATPRAVLCGRGVAPFDGVPVPARPDPVTGDLPLALTGPSLVPVLASGWQPDREGQPWSEGPHSTLMLWVPGGAGMVLTIRAAGIAAQPGGGRSVDLSTGGPERGGTGSPSHFTLRDGEATDLTVPVPAQPAGWLRVALDAPRPTDPARRGMDAPVRRAAIRLLGVTLDRLP